MTTKTEKNDKEIISDLTSKLLELAGVSCGIEVNEVETDSYVVDLKTEGETGLLIGFRGENINAIQTVLTLMFKGQTDKWVRIIVNIGDYRQKQEDKLKDLADQTIERVLQTGQPQPIYNLTPAERRIVHLYLIERKEIESYSEGEGVERYLVIAPKK